MEYHVPVLVNEVMDGLQLTPGGCYVDCTIGQGGHAEAILNRLYPDVFVVGIDRDPGALEVCRDRLARYRGRFTLVQGNFREVKELVRGQGISLVHGVLFDLGVSRSELEEAGRGFSYWKNGPLDMRMDPNQHRTAADLVNELPEKELARIIRQYGEEPWAERIASFIVERRSACPLKTTSELVQVIKDAVPASARRRGPHPARRTFQALRIAVNEELEALEEGLAGAVDLLVPGGRIAAISFHSLEDRIIKRFFADKSTPCTCPPKTPVCVCGKRRELRVITKKPIRPQEDEIRVNPRARSARLRIAERVAV